MVYVITNMKYGIRYNEYELHLTPNKNARILWSKLIIMGMRV